LAEITENTRRGARGLILPAPTRIGSPNEADLLADTAGEIRKAGLRPRDVAVDGGFQPGPVHEHLPDATNAFIAGQQRTGSKHTDRRLARYRVGAEGRISHLKRSYGLRRSRLRGLDGTRTSVGWSILTYNLDTLAIRDA
jgi:transposase, IS5 family